MTNVYHVYLFFVCVLDEVGGYVEDDVRGGFGLVLIPSSLLDDFLVLGWFGKCGERYGGVMGHAAVMQFTDKSNRVLACMRKRRGRLRACL